MIDAFEKLARMIGGVLPARREGFSDYEAGDFLLSGDDVRAGRMASDGPDQADPTPVPRADVRSALDELPDSKLLNLAATIIAGTARCLSDVDVLVDALRDRAAQFAAIEEPSSTPALLGAHLTDSTRRGE